MDKTRCHKLGSVNVMGGEGRLSGFSVTDLVHASSYFGSRVTSGYQARASKPRGFTVSVGGRFPFFEQGQHGNRGRGRGAPLPNIYISRLCSGPTAYHPFTMRSSCPPFGHSHLEKRREILVELDVPWGVVEARRLSTPLVP